MCCWQVTRMEAVPEGEKQWRENGDAGMPCRSTTHACSASCPADDRSTCTRCAKRNVKQTSHHRHVATIRLLVWMSLLVPVHLPYGTGDQHNPQVDVPAANGRWRTVAGRDSSRMVGILQWRFECSFGSLRRRSTRYCNKDQCCVPPKSPASALASQDSSEAGTRDTGAALEMCNSRGDAGNSQGGTTFFGHRSDSLKKSVASAIEAVTRKSDRRRADLRLVARGTQVLEAETTTKPSIITTTKTTTAAPMHAATAINLPARSYASVWKRKRDASRRTNLAAPAAMSTTTVQLTGTQSYAFLWKAKRDTRHTRT